MHEYHGGITGKSYPILSEPPRSFIWSFMEFFKGLFSVALVYALAWGLFHIGFMYGYDDAKNDFSKYRFDKTAKAFP